MNSLRPITQLEHLYPDIEGELCTRHSTTLARLKQVFVDLYSLQPSHCAIANGIVFLTPRTALGLTISFALQNGVMIYYRRTEPQQNLFVNSNREDVELILDNKGCIQHGQEGFLAEKMSKIFRIAAEDLSFTKVYGGIMYIHSNLPKGCFREEQTWLTAFFLAVSHLNGVLEQYSFKQLVKKMMDCGLLGSKQEIQNRVYNYLNRQLCIRADELVATVYIPKDVKLLFYALKSKFETESHKQQQKINHKQLQSLLRKQYNSTDLVKILSNPQNTDFSALPMKYAQIMRQQKKILQIMGACQTAEQFNQLLAEILKLNMLHHEGHELHKCPQVTDLLTNFRTDGHLLLQQYYNQNHIVFSTSKKRYTDLIQGIRQSLSPKKNRPKDILEHGRWDKKVASNEQIFSGLPSRGIAILDPSESMWFND